jgi:hypothetical protein
MPRGVIKGSTQIFLSLISFLPAAPCTRNHGEPWRISKASASTPHGSSRTHTEHQLWPKRVFSCWSEALRLRSARIAVAASGPWEPNRQQSTRFHLDLTFEEARCFETLYACSHAVAEHLRPFARFSKYFLLGETSVKKSHVKQTERSRRHDQTQVRIDVT